MLDLNLERIVMVNLYEVIESGYHIAHDSPAIGCWEEYDHWTEHHGVYTKEETAEVVKKKALDVLTKKYDTSSTEYWIKINKIMIPESDLILSQGQYYYIKEKQLLEIRYLDL